MLENNQISNPSNEPPMLNQQFTIPKPPKNNTLLIALVLGLILALVLIFAWFIFQKKKIASPIDVTVPNTETSETNPEKKPIEDDKSTAVTTSSSSLSGVDQNSAPSNESPENNTSATSNEEDYLMDDDGDGLTNYEEKILGTNLNISDTDGDTYLDNFEVKNGYNPKGEGKSDIFSETGICQVEYQKLIDEFGKSYADCYGNVSKASCKEVNKKSNIVMILDASGSMAGKIAGESKNNITKEASAKFIENLNNENQLSILMYGHKGNNQSSGKNESCAGIEELYTLSENNRAKAMEIARSLKANGYTPIGKSLEKVKNIFANKKGQSNMVILISDGEETCGGNPIAVSQSLKKEGIVVNVIGFDVGGSAEEQLRNIAENGSGAYYSARNPEELAQSLANLSKITCTQKENAWNDSLDSSLDKAHACFERINEESVNLQIKAATEMNLGFCLDYVYNKYNEREKSINEQIERASEESLEAVDELDPAFDGNSSE